MATLTFVDNANNTGGTLTVAGSGGATNSIYTSRYLGTSAQRAFVLSGTMVGDGSIAFAATAGPFVGFVVSDNAGLITVSTPIGFRVSDGSLALHKRCAVAIRDFVLSLAIPGLTTDPNLHVVTKVGASLEKVLNDGVPIGTQCVYYIPVLENYTLADNQFDSVRYPVLVVLLTESGQSLVSGLDDTLLYRELIHRGMSACNLLDVPEVHSVVLQPGAIVDPGRWVQNYDASVTTFICQSEQHSGIV